MRSRCNNGKPASVQAEREKTKQKTAVDTYFGFTDLLITEGLVLRFRSDFPSLGVVASRVMTEAATSSAQTSGHGRGADEVCETLHEGGVDAVERLRESYPSMKQEPVPVNLRYTSPNAAAPDVVFFGGAYDVRDRFSTMRGPVWGVGLHAAIYHSKPIYALSRVALYILEIGIGTALGFLLHWCWSAYGRQQRTMAERQAKAHGRRLSAAGAQWLRLRALGLLPLAAAVFSFLLLMIVVSRMFDSGFWVNPGALVAGIFLDSLHSGRASTVDHSPPVVQRFDLIWQVPLWLVAVCLVLKH
jgi:hypothetical protein